MSPSTKVILAFPPGRLVFFMKKTPQQAGFLAEGGLPRHPIRDVEICGKEEIFKEKSSSEHNYEVMRH